MGKTEGNGTQEKTRSLGRERPTKVFSVTSGKGGVGKSNLVINTGICLAELGRRVLVMDADMGLANIDILTGLKSDRNLSHVVRGEADIRDVICEGPSGVHILPACSGVEWVTHLTKEQQITFLEQMETLNGEYDILLIDTGAGISSNVLYFNLAAQTRIVLVTPEPTALTDAYAMIKVLNRTYRQKSFRIVVNHVRGEKEALSVYRNLTTVADRFLDVQLSYLGHVRRDDHLGRAVLRQKLVVSMYPDAPVSRDYREVATRIDRLPSEATEGEVGLFWRQIIDHSNA